MNNNTQKNHRETINFLRKVFLMLFIKTYNFFIHLYPRSKKVLSSNKFVHEIEKKSLVATDISAHLMTIFTEGLELKPRSIVELGTRGGESTFVFDRVVSLCDSKILCVDLNDCESVCPPNTFFVKSDDIAFGKRFKDWALENDFPPQIDLLFIDTSHEFEHTKAEISTYFPLLSENATVIFHDTNMRLVYKWSDNSLGYGYCENTPRGVIKAIEDYFGMKFNEKKDFVDYVNGWLIKHRATSSGLTVMKKIS